MAWDIVASVVGRRPMTRSADSPRPMPHGAIAEGVVERGEQRAALFAAPPSEVEKAEGEWLALTPKGFFAASSRDADVLAIVRGYEVTTIGQVHQSLFNPDLVREARAVEVLEMLNTPVAKELLEKLAKGAADASLTRECQAALDRLAKKAPAGH